ncbi:MAG: hypothetical protein H6816_05150 [Phycisphaerales bacterium]|nr:hypothetical protein [Phycisphaerales bacterium]
MTCENAQHDMQRRLDANGIDANGIDATRGFEELDAHLAVCPACARVWLDLLAMRQQLSGLCTDTPTSEETDAMWQAIAATAPLELPAFRAPARAVIFRFIGASAAVAACLLLAFVLGEQRYRVNQPRQRQIGQQCQRHFQSPLARRPRVVRSVASATAGFDQFAAARNGSGALCQLPVVDCESNGIAAAIAMVTCLLGPSTGRRRGSNRAIRLNSDCLRSTSTTPSADSVPTSSGAALATQG